MAINGGTGGFLESWIFGTRAHTGAPDLQPRLPTVLRCAGQRWGTVLANAPLAVFCSIPLPQAYTLLTLREGPHPLSFPMVARTVLVMARVCWMERGWVTEE